MSPRRGIGWCLSLARSFWRGLILTEGSCSRCTCTGRCDAVRVFVFTADFFFLLYSNCAANANANATPLVVRVSRY